MRRSDPFDRFGASRFILSRFGGLLASVSAIAQIFANNEPGFWFDHSDVADLDWRRNLLTETESFNAGIWSTFNVSIAGNTIAENSVNGQHYANANGINERVYSSSMVLYARIKQSVGSRNVALRAAGPSGSAWAIFNPSTGEFVGKGSSGSNWPLPATPENGVAASGGYWDVFFTATTTDPYGTFWVQMFDGTNISYQGDGASAVEVTNKQITAGTTVYPYQPITTLDAGVRSRFPKTTLYQDTVGTSPVTTAGQTVALELDKSKGLVLGPDIKSGTWDASAGWSSSGSTVTATGATSTITLTPTSSISGKWVRVVFKISASAGDVRVVVGSAFTSFIPASGTYSQTVFATSNSVFVDAGAAFTGTVEILSVQELPGNHATQPTAAKRPTYGYHPFGGVRNLLTQTENFEDAATWVPTQASVTPDIEVDPFGAMADRFVPSTAAASHFINQSITPRSGGYASLVVKLEGAIDKVTIYPGGGATFAHYDLTTEITSREVNVTSANMTSLGGGWFFLEAVWPAAVSVDRLRIYASSGSIGAAGTAGDGTSGVLISRANLSATATDYQRVGNEYDVTEAGVPLVHYLRYDGTDDFMVTPTITPGTDKLQVFAGVKVAAPKSNNSPIFQFGDATTSPTDALARLVTGDGSTEAYRAIIVGSASNQTARVTATAPYTAALSAIFDAAEVGAGEISLRENGLVKSTGSATDSGVTSFGSSAIWFGSNEGGTNNFKGNQYQLVGRFGPNLDADTIANVDAEVAQKTGIAI